MSTPVAALDTEPLDREPIVLASSVIQPITPSTPRTVANRAPRFIDLPPRITASTREAVTLTLNAHDPDGDALRWSVTPAQPLRDRVSVAPWPAGAASADLRVESAPDELEQCETLRVKITDQPRAGQRAKSAIGIVDVCEGEASEPEAGTAIVGRIGVGNALTGPGVPHASVSVWQNGTPLPRHLETNERGEYRFDVTPPNSPGTYRVDWGHHLYKRDTEQTVTVNPNQQVVLNFAAVSRIPEGYDLTLSGRIVDESGRGIEGVLVTALPDDFGGSRYATFSDAAGVYRFENLPKAHYKVTPFHKSYHTTPPEASFELSGNRDNLNFQAKRVSSIYRGFWGGTPPADLHVVTLAQPTGGPGRWEVRVHANRFSYEKIDTAPQASSHIRIDFYTGIITSRSFGYYDQATNTNFWVLATVWPDGHFTLIRESDGSVYQTGDDPSRERYNSIMDSLAANLENLSTALPVYYYPPVSPDVVQPLIAYLRFIKTQATNGPPFGVTVVGAARIIATGGFGVVKVRLVSDDPSLPPQETTLGAGGGLFDGRYPFGFSNVRPGKYTITPTSPGFEFYPPSRPLTITNTNVTVEEFRGTAAGSGPPGNYMLRGRIGIGNADTGPGLGGVNIRVVGPGFITQSDFARTEANGSYTFAVEANGNYILEPISNATSGPGYRFEPTSKTVTVSNGVSTPANFAAQAVNTSFTVSGRVGIDNADTGPGLPRAIVIIKGPGFDAPAAQYTNSQGQYTFSVKSNGDYVVEATTWSGSEYQILPPAAQTVTVNGAHATANFTAVAAGANALEITSQLPGVAIYGQSYTATLTARGGTLPYRWEVSGLPPSLTLNGNTINGTPSNDPPFAYRGFVIVTDGAGVSVRQPFTISLQSPDQTRWRFVGVVRFPSNAPLTRVDLDVYTDGTFTHGVILTNRDWPVASYQLPLLTPGRTYVVRTHTVDAPGLTVAPESVGPFNLPAGTVILQDFDVKPVTGGLVLDGQVSAGLQQPILGATVTLLSGSNAIGSATTDNGGHYRMANLQPGTYTLRVTAAGFQTATRPVTLTTHTTVNLTLTRESAEEQTSYTISGHVRWPNGAGVGGVTLVLNGSKTTTTNADGSYAFTDLANGTYGLGVRSRPDVERYEPPVVLAITVPTTAPKGAATQDFTAHPYALGIVNVLFPQATVGQAYTLDLDPIGGVAPFTWSARDLPPGLRVQGSRMTGTPTVAGTYAITLTVTDRLGTQFTTNPLALEVAPAVQQGVEISGPLRTIGDFGIVRVVLASTNPNGPAPVENVLYPGGGLFDGRFGGFGFSSVQPGEYTITPTNPEVDFYPRSRTITVGTVSVSVGEFIGTAAGSGPPGQYTIRGRVGIGNADTGPGLAGVYIQLFGVGYKTGSTIDVTDADGRFSFTVEANGGYTLNALPGSTTGYRLTPTQQTVTVSNGVSAPANFTAIPNAKPDLTVSLRMEPAFPRVGDAVRWTFFVQNAGDVPAPASRAELRINGQLIETIPVVPVPPHETYSYQTNAWRPQQAGAYAFLLTLDAGNEVDESNETNNAFPDTIQVQSGASLPPLTVSPTTVTQTLQRDPGHPLLSTFGPGFTITNPSNEFRHWILYPTQEDARYTPPGGSPQPITVDGFGFAADSGGMPANNSSEVASYVSNSRAPGRYTGSYTLLEQRGDDRIQVAVLYYDLTVVNPPGSEENPEGPAPSGPYDPTVSATSVVAGDSLQVSWNVTGMYNTVSPADEIALAPVGSSSGTRSASISTGNHRSGTATLQVPITAAAGSYEVRYVRRNGAIPQILGRSASIDVTASE